MGHILRRELAYGVRVRVCAVICVDRSKPWAILAQGFEGPTPSIPFVPPISHPQFGDPTQLAPQFEVDEESTQVGSTFSLGNLSCLPQALLRRAPGGHDCSPPRPRLARLGPLGLAVGPGFRSTAGARSGRAAHSQPKRLR